MEKQYIDWHIPTGEWPYNPYEYDPERLGTCKSCGCDVYEVSWHIDEHMFCSTECAAKYADEAGLEYEEEIEEIAYRKGVTW